MFLSNPHAATAALSLVIFAVAGCSWFQTSDPVTLSPTAIAPPDTGLPFDAFEPETYQADFITIAADAESKSHFARKPGRWRIDTFAGDKLVKSILRTDKLLYIDHGTKQYSEPPIAGPDPQPTILADLTTSLLSEKQPAKFEKIGTDGTLERYSVTVEGSSPSTIVFDTSTKMIVRHEFEGGFAFEMRNFNLEVDDATFALPAGYRKVAWNVFKQQ